MKNNNNTKTIELCSSSEETKQINSLLNLNKEYYTIADVFNILPHKIEYMGKGGYLKISSFDIVYSSLETEMQGKVVAIFQYLLNNETIFTAFINALKFLLGNNIMKKEDLS